MPASHVAGRQRGARWHAGACALLLASALAGGAAAAAGSAANHAVDPTLTKPAAAPADGRQAESAIVAAVNAFRRERGLGELARDDTLGDAARAYAEHLARTLKVGHTADGREPAERVEAAGYDYCEVRENVGFVHDPRGFDAAALARRFVEGWKDSPGHRENLLAAHVIETGVALARSPETGAWFAVELLARPRGRSIHLTVINETGEPVAYTLDGDDDAGPQRYTAQPGSVHRHERCQPHVLELPRGAGAESESSPIEVAGRTVVRIERPGRAVVEHPATAN